MKPFSRYLPIDEAIFESSLFLTSAGRAVVLPRAVYPPAGHPALYQFAWEDGRVLPEFSLVWIAEGMGIWETRRRALPIRAGEVGQVFPGEWHRYRPDAATGWTECWLQFNGRLAHELIDSGAISVGDSVRKPHQAKPFYRQFQELLEDISSPSFINSEFQGLRVAGLLGLLHQPATGPTIGPSLVQKALHTIWSYSHAQLDVNEVASRLAVSRRTLERAFSTEGKRGVLEEITRCRINRAERLLRETRLPLKNIAGLAGFGTTEQMRLQFQSRHGKSPGAYRDSAL